VAYYDEDGGLVTDRRLIARNYARWRLWVDLATTIPFDWCARAMGRAAKPPAAAQPAEPLPHTPCARKLARTRTRAQRPTPACKLAIRRIVLGAMGQQQANTIEARYVGLLRLLRLGRAYRLNKARPGVLGLVWGGGRETAAAAP
jgi:hypothetical protein